MIALRDHASKFGLFDPTLAEIIRDELQDVSHEPREWFERQLERGKLLILFDGLDEVASVEQRQLLASWVDRQQRQYSSTLFVITSRPFGYTSNQLSSAIVLQVKHFTSAQVELFVRSWYNATISREYGSDSSEAAAFSAKRQSDDLIRRLRENAALDDLAANPLLLTLIANVHHYRGALPGTRSELYKEVCEVFLGARHRARGVALDMQPAQKQEILQFLAFAMMTERTRDVTLKAAVEIIAGILSEVSPGTHAPDFLNAVEASSGLLIEREAGEYAFSHLTFQEYLAATHMAQKGLSEAGEIDVDDSWWHETLRLYCAQADATPVVELCVAQAGSDPNILALAVDCMKAAYRLDPGLRQKLKGLIEPSNVREDLEARRIAASIQMLLRVRDLSKVDEDARLSTSPITCLEYQLFLDEQRDPNRFRPDAWKTPLFEEGEALDPMAGLRSSDAIEFATWFNRTIGDNYFYRLATVGELTSTDARRALRKAPVSVPVALAITASDLATKIVEKCTPVALKLTDEREILTTIASYVRKDSTEIPRLAKSLDAIMPQIEVNLIESQVLRNPKLSRILTKSQLRPRRLGNLLVPNNFSAWLSDLADSAESSFIDATRALTALDADALTGDIGSTFDAYDNAIASDGGLQSTIIYGHNIGDVTSDVMPRTTAGPAIGQLAAIFAWEWLAVLMGASRAALRREILARINPDDVSALRLVARISALVLLHISAIYPNSTDIKHRVPSRMRPHASRDPLDASSEHHVRRKSSGGTTMSLQNVSFFLDIYAKLAVYEGRIERSCKPTEGIYIVRSSGTDPYEG